MPPELTNIEQATGHTAEELVEMADTILEPAADLAGQAAADVGAPAGAIVVTFMAFDTRGEEGKSAFGVMPVKSIWMLSGGLDESDDDAPLATDAERAWAQNVMANALAFKIDDDDEQGRAVYLREMIHSVVRFAQEWGYEVTLDGSFPERTPPSRSRVPRTMRPSGPGGRSPKQRRKR